MRLCRVQKLAVVLLVDDCHTLPPSDRDDLDRLAGLDPHPGALLSIVRLGRPSAHTPAPVPWELTIRLEPLSRDEANDYLHAKLAAAGRPDPIFTARAVSRLHALAGGIPRGLDRLATLALLAGALQRQEEIGPDLVDHVAAECEPAPSEAA